MRVHPLAKVLLVAAVLGWSAVSNAQSTRCGSRLVSVGDSTESVREKCGEPVARSRRCVTDPDQYQPGQVTACVDVEEWTYRPGYGQYVTTFRFEDGALSKIIYGDRM